jgi:hypothetical protein
MSQDALQAFLLCGDGTGATATGAVAMAAVGAALPLVAARPR